MPDSSPLVVIADESQGWKGVSARIRGSAQSVIVIVPPQGIGEPEGDGVKFFRELRALNNDRSVTIASKHAPTVVLAKRAGWQTIDRIRHLKKFLKQSPQLLEALRTFSPHFWRGQIRTQLQSIGLLSLPTIRIWVLLAASIGVFLFIILRLLPSATIRVWPNQETVTQTVNVYLVSSGAVNVPVDRVRTIPLIPITVRVERTMTFDDIGKEFTGKNSQLAITVHNGSKEQISLRRGTRFVNQAGMVFKLQSDVIISAGANKKVKTLASDVDQFGEIIGERGNVPAGIKWEIPGLEEDLRASVYGRNDQPGVGGSTSYRNVLKREDLEVAKKKIEQDLLIAAKQLTSEERDAVAKKRNVTLTELDYDELTRTNYTNIKLPEEFVGQHVASVPVSGTIFYTVLLYDPHQLFSLLKNELFTSVGDQKVMEEDSIREENLVLHVIDAPWDAPVIDWVKLTVDLSGTERYVLDPLTPVGALFAKRARDSVVGKPKNDAERIIKNFPEISKVSISIWPFWNSTLPSIASNIFIEEQR